LGWHGETDWMDCPATYLSITILQKKKIYRNSNKRETKKWTIQQRPLFRATRRGQKNGERKNNHRFKEQDQ